MFLQLIALVHRSNYIMIGFISIMSERDNILDGTDKGLA